MKFHHCCLRPGKKLFDNPLEKSTVCSLLKKSLQRSKAVWFARNNIRNAIRDKKRAWNINARSFPTATRSPKNTREPAFSCPGSVQIYHDWPRRKLWRKSNILQLFWQSREWHRIEARQLLAPVHRIATKVRQSESCVSGTEQLSAASETHSFDVDPVRFGKRPLAHSSRALPAAASTLTGQRFNASHTRCSRLGRINSRKAAKISPDDVFLAELRSHGPGIFWDSRRQHIETSITGHKLGSVQPPTRSDPPGTHDVLRRSGRRNLCLFEADSSS